MAIVFLSLLMSVQVTWTLCIRGKNVDAALDACDSPELHPINTSVDDVAVAEIPLNPAKQPPKEWVGLHGEVWRNKALGAGPRIELTKDNGYGLLKSPEATEASLGEFDNMKVIVDLQKRRLTMISYYPASNESGLVGTIIEDGIWIGFKFRDSELANVYDVDHGYAETGWLGLAGLNNWVKFKVRDLERGGKSQSEFHSNPRYKVVFDNSRDASDFKNSLLVCGAQTAWWANKLGWWSTPELHHPQKQRTWEFLSGWAWRTYGSMPGFVSPAVINPDTVFEKGSYGQLGGSREKECSLGDFVNMHAMIDPDTETLTLVHARSAGLKTIYDRISIRERIYDVNRGYLERHALLLSGLRWWVRFKVREDADNGTSRALHWSHSNPRFSLTFKKIAGAVAFQKMLVECGAQESTLAGKMANSSWSA